nr:MAG TPA: hypothetical protein [Caudoviricetes sp.]
MIELNFYIKKDIALVACFLSLSSSLLYHIYF